jgi:hypothetical protein
MIEAREIFIVSIPSAMGERVAPLLPAGFAPAAAAPQRPDFRFGVSEFQEYVGAAKDMADLVVALLGVVAALRAAGGGKVGVRSATQAESVEIDTGMDEAAIRAKLTQRRDQ